MVFGNVVACDGEAGHRPKVWQEAKAWQLAAASGIDGELCDDTPCCHDGEVEECVLNLRMSNRLPIVTKWDVS